MLLTEDEVVAAYRLHSFSHVYYAVVVCAVLALGSWPAFELFGPKARAGQGVGTFVIALSIWGWMHFSFWPNRFRRIYRQQKAMQREISFRVTEQGLEGHGEMGGGTTPWDDILKWKESPTMFLVYHSEALFQIVPKRFLSAEDAAQLRARLSRLDRRP